MMLGLSAQKLTKKKRFGLFQAELLILAICAIIGSAAAAEQPGKPVQKEAPPGLPPAGTYKIDPLHTFAYFGAWHHVVGLVRGRFDKVEGTITVSPDPAACAVDVTIDTSTVSTQVGERDDDLRSPAFFDSKKFPAMTYQGRGIHRVSKDQWTMDGTLSIRGISQVVPLTFTFKGLFPDTPPGKPNRAAFHATAAAKRGDFGMTRDNADELGVPPKPGFDVDIQIDVEADAEPAP